MHCVRYSRATPSQQRSPTYEYRTHANAASRDLHLAARRAEPARAVGGRCAQRRQSLRDPAGLLEGSGNQARHIKLRTQATLDDPAVQDLIAQALELATAPIDPSQPRRLIIKSVSAKQRPRRP